MNIVFDDWLFVFQAIAILYFKQLNQSGLWWSMNPNT